jgi:hypothetical protein
MRRLSIVLSAVVCVSSCVVEDSEDGDEFVPDPGTSDDRGGDGPDRRPSEDEPVPASCEIAESYERVEPVEQETAFVGETEDGDDYVFVETTISASGGEHLVAVDLWNGYGVFEEGWTAGSYALTGQETDYDHCGACVYVLEDWDPADNTYSRLLMAEDGYLDIERVEPTPGWGHLTGTVEAATFREVNETSDGYVEVEQGCTTWIDTYSFDAPVVSVEEYRN